MARKARILGPLLLVCTAGLFLLVETEAQPGGGRPDPRPLGPLPALGTAPDAGQVALGKALFFDGRLSGDATVSCATCHIPDKGLTDGLPLSKGYPGSLYFRNTPTLLNAAQGTRFYWDGRLDAGDIPTLVRDHIAEAHFMQADGRLVIERMRQVPAYENGFKEVFGKEPTYGGILNSVAAFVRTLRSKNVPFDAFIQGEESAISESAKKGLALFQGKAGCIRCHDGPMLADGGSHNLALPENREIFRNPERHITFRRFLKTLGVSDYASLRQDVGLFAVTKIEEDRGKFRTPTLREVSRTAPYMHNGSLATLEEVVEFYNEGCGNGPGKDISLEPLGLSGDEKGDLVEFLKTLSGEPIDIDPVEMAEYEVRPLGEN